MKSCFQILCKIKVYISTEQWRCGKNMARWKRKRPWFPGGWNPSTTSRAIRARGAAALCGRPESVEDVEKRESARQGVIEEERREGRREERRRASNRARSARSSTSRSGSKARVLKSVEGRGRAKNSETRCKKRRRKTAYFGGRRL